MGQNDLASNDLDGNGTADLSQKRPKSQLPWFYHCKSTEVSPDKKNLSAILPSPPFSELTHQ